MMEALATRTPLIMRGASGEGSLGASLESDLALGLASLRGLRRNTTWGLRFEILGVV